MKTISHNRSLYILSVEAKDLYAAITEKSDGGFRIRNRENEISVKKFINTLDYSLDAIKLREVYEKTTRRKNFSFCIDGKFYTQQVINVKFNYSFKEFNKCGKNTYVRAGYHFRDCEFNDGVFIKDNRLIAVKTQTKILNPICKDLLGKFFSYNETEQTYVQTGTIPVIKDKSALREYLYKNGFECDGIKYVRYKRSSGSSRVGKCLFVNKIISGRMLKWDKCGLDLKKGQEIDLAAWEAYISLPMSSIIDTINILPENILIIDDYESEFENTVIAVEEKNKSLTAAEKTVKIKNNIFDGESVMDSSLFSSYKDKGMLLLRNRFFKSCTFNCNLKRWFSDNNITKIEQLNGFTLAKSVDDIKLITTPSSIKYLKFGSAEQWLRNIEPTFGIVKYEKEPHFFNGRMVQTHYQLLNTLQLSFEEVQSFLEPSFDYINKIRSDPDILRHHISYPKNSHDISDTALSSKNEIIFRLLGINNRFCKTKLYYDFKSDLVRALINNLKNGKVLINGNYSTLFGNGMEMLKAAIGTFDGTSELKKNQICSSRFKSNTKILGSRSPHVTMGDIAVFENVKNENYNKYFNLSRSIVCINSINENILQRLQGADFDSDSILLTDDSLLVSAAEKNYNSFKVPVNMVTAFLKKRTYSPEQQADLDVKTSINKIGEDINLSQQLNSLLWDRVNSDTPIENTHELYCDICKLSVLSGIEIDKAKREFVIDSGKEIKKLKEKYKIICDKKTVKPMFFKRITINNGYTISQNTKYKYFKTTMDYFQKAISSYIRSYNRGQSLEFEPFFSMIRRPRMNPASINQGYYYEQKNFILQNARIAKKKISSLYCEYESSTKAERESIRERAAEIKEDFIKLTERKTASEATMFLLLQDIEKSSNKDIARFLFEILFKTPNRRFFAMIENSRETLNELTECNNGSIRLYNYYYDKSPID